MTFEELPLAGAYQIGIDPHADERGFFARTVCEDTLVAHGLVGRFRQSSVSYNRSRGTVRGMHYAVAPHAETKLVRCTMGAIHDVLVDLRRDSPTYLRATGVVLSAENRVALYIPAGFAHGFQALQDETEVLYMIDRPYVAGAARGVRWDDPALDIAWPEPVTVISERDLAFPAWTGLEPVV
ncbi:dTDP-4-dehydrorhamnose 3,5-epimerase family protein [Methylobacterium radiotolerans]|uniref:dTDP-4-dehydrorhamnose 3,5-epimerase family protein n=1 Tax=Methylobacterium radiotolerans TaxID=31998 RepID=UPI000978A480|nr:MULTISPECIES: dTDP-4-dehydrorhamnose 3,5-epimerase family protein [Methylobacterium]MDE3749490.1 dTDP-4-dehydrorhamnose 3,5-epimerase family protein [Methylobacterium radiotolerans]ONF48375.1 dTDP-4-dehydrorhamnose 3,5-epimerase [Methylobacterium radiotolerans]PVY94270.1 dTDP-4-dehydrorhamnose 3,5-epimerase [Methylobacterium organophilum]